MLTCDGKQPNELPAPTFRDTALYRLPIFLYSVTIGRALRPAKPKTDEAASDAKPEPKPQPRRKPAPRRPAVESSSDEDDDSSDDDSQPTPSSGSSTGDFEVLGRSTTEEAKKATAEGAKASGSQQQSGKARKRGKKR